MIEKVFDKPQIYRVFVELPQNPLKMLNAYVIKTPDENLIIDTGFNRPECKAALMKGLHELDIDMSRTSIFITHLHSDHVGLVPSMLEEHPRQVYMSAIDYQYLNMDYDGSNWSALEERYVEEGFPEDTMIALRTSNQARIFAPPVMFPVVETKDQDVIRIGGYEFLCIHTPGHTPGHMCLYYEAEKLLFSGDHVLFDITPNNTSWPGIENSLLDYIKSLKKIIAYDVKRTFPAHRGEFKTLYERVEELLRHHEERLALIEKVLKEEKEANAYQIAGRLKWNMRGTPWEEFPDNQKWFAVGETLSHLDYLRLEGKVLRVEKDGQIFYRSGKNSY